MTYKQQLSKDKKLLKILQDETHELQSHSNITLRLIASIISQQLSTKVAKVIYERFLDLYGKQEPKPQQIIETSIETLRSVGLSNAKASYVKNVAAFCLEHKITDKKLNALSNKEIIELLTQIKGVGSWTVEMLLMFSLGREDVFAVDDLGIQQAMIKLYKLENLDKKALKQKMISISEKWSPHKTYACLHLWSWKDNG